MLLHAIALGGYNNLLKIGCVYMKSRGSPKRADATKTPCCDTAKMIVEQCPLQEISIALGFKGSLAD
jgi:hypothetical protein